MKTSLKILPILAAFFSGQGFAQEVRTPPTTTVATLPEPISDVAPSEPSPPVKKPDFQIETTQVKLIDVVESPPLSGLPPVEGTMTLTVHSVADPGIPDPPKPTRPAVDDSQTMSELEPLNVNHREIGMVMLSATVYDHKRTLLQCNIYGGGGAKEITAWSNLDFNHFCGLGGFDVTAANGEVRNYLLMMSIGDETANHEGPAIPAIPNGTPAFVIQTENPDPVSLNLIEDLHAYYRTEGSHMAAAAEARKKAYEEQKAYLLAHPPKPKDVTVHFWKREESAADSKGGQP
jgi:hypothetical protein